jgi:hypothetical protein
MYEKSRRYSNSTLIIYANGYGCISKNVWVLNLLALLLRRNNMKFSDLKHLEMEKGNTKAVPC